MVEHPNVSQLTKYNWARDAFLHTSKYDTEIFNYFNNSVNIPLKYCMNPHQTPEYVNNNNAFCVINGTLGYINVLDCLHGWLMAYEIFKTSGKITYSYMKHTSPAGLGI